MKRDEAREILSEYYKQTLEDCRTVGDQKYRVLIYIAATFAGMLYVTIRINEVDPSYKLNKLIFLVIIIFSIVIIALFWALLFLCRHLLILDKIAIKIEELQRDILFKKMGDKYLFCWDDIPGNDNKKLKEFLIKNFNVKWIKNAKIEKSENSMTIQLSAGNIFKKSLSLILNDSKTTATLTVNDIIDEFIVKIDEDKLKVFEPELKYRFREIYPHSNVLNQSIRLQIITTVLIITFILIILFWYNFDIDKNILFEIYQSFTMDITNLK